MLIGTGVVIFGAGDRAEVAGDPSTLIGRSVDTAADRPENKEFNLRAK